MTGGLPAASAVRCCSPTSPVTPASCRASPKRTRSSTRSRDEPAPVYALLSGVLDAMASALAPSFAVAKFEGDAIFAVAPDGRESVRGDAVTASLRACYAAFAERLAQGRSELTCDCNSCSLVNGLDLKFVLHHGDYVLQRIVGREELAGPEVIVAHRLLKNHARDVVGARPVCPADRCSTCRS